MFYVVLLTLFYLPTVFNIYGFDEAYLTARDFLILAFSFGMFARTSMRQWKDKIISSVFVLLSLHMVFNNIIVDYADVAVALAFTSIVGMITVAFTMYELMSIRYDKLPDDDIIEGNIYEIIGKPKTDLQFILFVLTGGRGGSYAITNGTDCVYMSRKEGKSVKEPLSDNYLINKKCILIGCQNTYNKTKFHAKVNVKFYLWRNCYWLSKGFQKDDNIT